jgi:glycolate oxidase FAD binding subunit
MSDGLAQEFAEKVKAAATNKQTLAIVGGGTKAFYAQPKADGEVNLGAYSGIVDYDPRELVVTVKAGTKLSELQKRLAENGQMLACESPAFGEDATIGGTVACAFSGPRRAYTAALRDYVLGVKMINGQGEILRLGGQVMKNVAGFDVPRLLCGSLGSLGIILEVSLKVLPLPHGEKTLVHEMPMGFAVGKTHQSLQAGLPVTGSAYDNGKLYLRISGGEKTLASVSSIIGGDQVSDDASNTFWQQLKEQQLDFFNTDLPLWRVSLAANATMDQLGDQLFDWGGMLRWIKTDCDAQQVFDMAKLNGGHASLFRNPANQSTMNRHQPLSGVQRQWHKRLKAAFDSANTFNPNLSFVGA